MTQINHTPEHGEQAPYPNYQEQEELIKELVQALEAINAWMRGYGTKTQNEIHKEYVLTAIEKTRGRVMTQEVERGWWKLQIIGMAPCEMSDLTLQHISDLIAQGYKEGEIIEGADDDSL